MDCVVVVKSNDENQTDEIEIKEFRKLEIGDSVILGRTEDASREYMYILRDFHQIRVQ